MSVRLAADPGLLAVSPHVT